MKMFKQATLIKKLKMSSHGNTTRCQLKNITFAKVSIRGESKTSDGTPSPYTSDYLIP